MRLKLHGGKGIQPESWSVYYNLIFIYRSISHRAFLKALFSVARLIRQLIKITSSQLKWNVFVKKYNLTMSQIYRRQSQLDILLQKLFEGWHAESVKQHLNVFATRKKEVKMTIAESCR